MLAIREVLIAQAASLYNTFMEPSYSFQGALRYYGQIPASVTLDSDGVIKGTLSSEIAKSSGWQEPPHIALANLREEVDAAIEFTRLYGPISEPSIGAPDHWRRFVGQNGILQDAADFTMPELQRLRNLETPVKGTFSLRPEDLFLAQNRLRLAWRGEQTIVVALRQSVMTANFQISTVPNPKLEEILLRTPLLWEFMKMAFLIDYDTGRAAICANDRCDKPYFLRQRVDQELCSHRCGVERNNARRSAGSRTRATRRRGK